MFWQSPRRAKPPGGCLLLLFRESEEGSGPTERCCSAVGVAPFAVSDPVEAREVSAAVEPTPGGTAAVIDDMIKYGRFQRKDLVVKLKKRGAAMGGSQPHAVSSRTVVRRCRIQRKFPRPPSYAFGGIARTKTTLRLRANAAEIFSLPRWSVCGCGKVQPGWSSRIHSKCHGQWGGSFVRCGCLRRGLTIRQDFDADLK